MSLSIVKRLDIPARTAHVLLREQLVYGLGYAAINAYSSAGDLTTRLKASGIDGVCDSLTPQIFTSGTANFSNTLIGHYLTLYDTNGVNAGIHKIVGVPTTKTLLVQGGLYGSSFSTDTSIAYRVIDPTTNTGDTEFTVQGGIGTAPIWQARFFINASDTSNKIIRMEVAPNGGFVAGSRVGTGTGITGASPSMILTTSNSIFSANDVGRYITISGADAPNNGTFKITTYTSPTQVTYTNASGTAFGACTGTILGGWSGSVLTDRAISSDPALDRWYFKLAQSNVILWTENTAGTGVYNIGYAGSALTRRPADDSDFAVMAGGTISSVLTDFAVISATTPNTQVVYRAIYYGDAAINNVFTGLPSSEFDARNDSADLAIGCNQASHLDDDRGILHGLQLISSLINYKAFVDNGRQLLSLGGGIAVEWDGSLAR